jgi:hypothetical protein
MSHLKAAGSAANSNMQTLIMAFIGTMIAIAVSFAIFSLTQTANAQSTAKTADFDKYAQAYMAGFTANMQQNNGTSTTNNGGSCSEPEAKAAPVESAPVAVSHHKAKAELVKHVTNSYNNYMTNTMTVNKSYEKNINSNNTSSTNVVVKDSDGAVVVANSSTSGDNENKVYVKNEDSNNDTDVHIEDSFNKDSHDKTVIVNDSFNETNTEVKNDTTIINDSFNKVEVDLVKPHYPEHQL